MPARRLLAIGVLVTIATSYAAATYTSGGASTPVALDVAANSHGITHIVPPADDVISRDGVDYHVQPAPVAAVLRDKRSVRRLQLFVLQPTPSSTPGCNTFVANVHVISESAASVTVAASGYKPAAAKSSKYVTCAYDSENLQAQYVRFVVTLKAPLGARNVLDAQSGEIAGVLDNILLKVPAYIPAGYRLTLDHGFDPESGFVGLRQYTNGASAIEVRTRSESVWKASGRVVATAMVGPYMARISNAPWERCVIWRDHPGLVREVCSLGDGTFLPVDQLLQIAESIR